jgi:hypothetical protein
MTRSKSPHLEVLDESPLAGCVFRVAAFENGSCQYDLSAVIEPHERGGYGITFYRHLSDAEGRCRPLKSFEARDAELIVKALERLREHQDAWLNGEP